MKVTKSYWVIFWFLTCLLIAVPTIVKDWIVSFFCWVVWLYLLSIPPLVHYVVEGDTLTVFTGFFTKTRIPISSITSVKYTHEIFRQQIFLDMVSLFATTVMMRCLYLQKNLRHLLQLRKLSIPIY
ncbi:MAG: PH domain-containing protein [Prevotella sp.]